MSFHGTKVRDGCSITESWSHLHYLREIDGKPPYDTVIGYFTEGGDLRKR